MDSRKILAIFPQVHIEEINEPETKHGGDKNTIPLFIRPAKYKFKIETHVRKLHSNGIYYFTLVQSTYEYSKIYDSYTKFLAHSLLEFNKLVYSIILLGVNEPKSINMDKYYGDLSEEDRLKKMM